MKLNRAFFPVLVMAVLLMAGFSGNSLAVNMNPGGLAFAMYGNDKEFIKNLGPVSKLLTPGAKTTFKIDPSTLSAVSGSGPVNWALIGYESNASSVMLLAGSSKPLTAYSPTELSRVSIVNPTNVTINWVGQNSGDGRFQKLLPASDMNSFTHNFGTDGSLAGGFPVTMQGRFGSTLSIISGDYTTKALSLFGKGTLSIDGSVLTIYGDRSGRP